MSWLVIDDLTPIASLEMGTVPSNAVAMKPQGNEVVAWTMLGCPSLEGHADEVGISETPILVPPSDALWGLAFLDAVEERGWEVLEDRALGGPGSGRYPKGSGEHPRGGVSFPTGLTKISGAMGSNPGGVYKDAEGQKWYVKNYRDPEQAYGEHLSNGIYEAAGINAPVSVLGEKKGEYASKWLDDVKGTLQSEGLDKETANQVLDGFAADVFLSNWDTVGLTRDNVAVHGDGGITRIDQGGTLLHRAQGALKPASALSSLSEWDFFSSGNKEYRDVFTAAGVKSGDALGKRAIGQIDKLISVRPAGGWAEFVDHRVPNAPAAWKAKVSNVLEIRHGLLLEKRQQLSGRGLSRHELDRDVDSEFWRELGDDIWRELGGAGSGNFDHAGRPGQVGGSALASFVKATAAQRKELKLPPAWTDVLINPDPEGDVVAVGTDKKGRQQRRYSVAHGQRAAAEKFERLKAFNEILPGLREQVENDLASDDLEVVEAATLVRLIDRTAFRVGSNRDTKADKKAYGASTLRSYHVKVDGDEIAFGFVGKKGVRISKKVTDAKLARAIESRIQDRNPLFPTGADTRVRAYISERAPGFTPKDFRTYHGTAQALKALKKMDIPESMTKAQTVKLRREVAKRVAKHLGNTPAVSLSSYIDPAVFGKLVKP